MFAVRWSEAVWSVCTLLGYVWTWSEDGLTLNTCDSHQDTEDRSESEKDAATWFCQIMSQHYSTFGRF